MINKLIYAVLLLILMFSVYSFADEHKGSKNFPFATNDVYRDTCGSCHFLYQPGLLPKRSWIKIVDNLDKHQGENISLDKATEEEIKKYLIKNSAENSSVKRSRKILASIGSNDTPLRISETPYILKKHRKIPQNVFNRKSIGSRANCIACHKNVNQGNYKGDDVIIPGN